MPLGEEGTQLLEHALKTGDFRYLADHAEENGMPVLASILRNHTPSKKVLHYEPYEGYEEEHSGPPEQGEWETREAFRDRRRRWLEDGYDPEDVEAGRHSAKYAHDLVKRSPELIPGVHLKPVGNGYRLYDFRDPLPHDDHPEIEELYEQGLDDSVTPRLNELQEEYLDNHPSEHHFGRRGSTAKLDLAKPIKPYVPPGKPIHITGLSKGGNCTHCGKQEIHRIHIKDPETGEECQIGSTCAHEALVGMGGQKPTQKKLLHLAAVAQQYGHQIKDFRLASEGHSIAGLKKKLELSRGDEEALWPHVNDLTHRLILADVLEESGDPLHHVLRNPHDFSTSGNLGNLSFFMPHNHDFLHSYGIGVFSKNDKGNHVVSLQPHGLPPYYGEVTHEQLKDIARQHYAPYGNHNGEGPSWRNHQPAKDLTLTRVDPDYHSQQEVYAALVAEGVDPTEAERLSHALS